MFGPTGEGRSRVELYDTGLACFGAAAVPVGVESCCGMGKLAWVFFPQRRRSGLRAQQSQRRAPRSPTGSAGPPPEKCKPSREPCHSPPSAPSLPTTDQVSVSTPCSLSTVQLGQHANAALRSCSAPVVWMPRTGLFLVGPAITKHLSMLFAPRPSPYIVSAVWPVIFFWFYINSLEASFLL